MGFLFLMLAIVCELIGTSLLKASAGFSKLLPTLGLLVSFTLAFFFLSLALKTIPLNLAYAIWSGLGTVATVVISILVWHERVNFASIAGIALIIIGVIILNLYAPGHHDAADKNIPVKKDSRSSYQANL
ncbi:Quaternary ammonium compound-resistance protein qacG [Desulforamulus hydrothermalis Lam5 = DSM 18033]|uniref:Quaternary ammonium compound-resistance protein qacG n=1 Tax=Desulforamulus hydrothermalis Lam5 = DSM 18033 TaxID=1121428 RepID=K8E738_9FIRM|nr:multidrug efflux SMR transporter [Desulforamulus hydrothermalis]CCO07293.1 Quaternary ammonium compound-resistance protein qacG [Desulforamulus hydrothermalis Lam5 = DSM 18033]SHG93374.1 small multidrug resistance pump [Desulforamulus hydrothermalis Lam5 = DSM 18033]